MKQILKRPLVKEDLIGHYETIAKDKLKPAERFLRVAEEAFFRLAPEDNFHIAFTPVLIPPAWG